MKKKKHPGGRPRKTTDDLPDNWREIVIQRSLEGLTEQEIRKELCLSMGNKIKSITMLWYRLRDRDAEFREVLKMGRVFCEAWWIKKARSSLNKKFFQSAPWIFTMKNLFKENWRDKQEIDVGATDELLEKYKEMNANELIKRQQTLARSILGISGDAARN